MKKLFIFIISILFVVNVSALTIQNDSYLKYVDIRSNTNYNENIKGSANYDSGTIYFSCDYIANSYGCGVQFHTKENLDLKAGKSYSFSLDIGVTGSRLVKSTSTKGDHFGLSAENSSNYFVAFDNWFNTSINSMPYVINSVDINYINDSSQIITFSFTMKEDVSNASVFFFPFGLNKTGIYASTIFEVNYLSIDSTNDDVINSIESTSQEIIKNQNENNEKVLDAIDRVNENFNTCRDSYNLFNGRFENIGFWSLVEGQVSTIARGESYVSSVVVPVVSGQVYSISRNVITSRFTVGFANSLVDGSSVLISKSSTTNKIENLIAPNGYDTMIIYLSNSNLDTSNLKIMVNEGSFVKDYEPYGEQICTNKIDDTNDKLDNIGDSITDSDTSGATGTGQGFFDNFNDQDNGGISGIVRAPLSLITNLLGSNSTNSCKDLPLSIMGKDVYIPCGKILWSKVPSSTLTIYHTIICGIGAYAILSMLYKDIEDLKNPNTSEVRTTDL